MTDDEACRRYTKYRPDIDGLRAIAVFTVILFHVSPTTLNGGFIGVDVFFVISGYLISTIIFDALNKDSFSFFYFYSRRIKRIFPALILVISVCLVFGWFVLLPSEYKHLGKYAFTGASFVSNFFFWQEAGYFDTAAHSKPFLHLWSLSLEEQFYVVWPFFIWFVWKTKYNLFTLIVLITASSLLLNISNVQQNLTATFYSPQTRLWELTSGSLLAWLTIFKKERFVHINDKIGEYIAPLVTQIIIPIVYKEPKKVSINVAGRILPEILATIGLVFLAYGFLEINKDLNFPGGWALIPVIGTLFLIMAGPHTFWNKIFLSNNIIVWFGLISFPLYLWHWPILSFTWIIEGQEPSISVRISAVLLAILLSWLTYKLIESPLRFGKRQRFTVGGLVVAMFVVAFLGYNIHHRNGMDFREIVELNKIDNHHSEPINATLACERILELSSRHCQIYKPSSNGKTNKKVIVWGDSMAGVFLPVLQDIANKENFNLISISHASCPPILGARKTSFPHDGVREYCQTGMMQNSVVDFISKERPNLIIVVAQWNRYSPKSMREYITNTLGLEPPPANKGTTEATLRQNLPKTIASLSSISNVLVFKPWPILSSGLNYPIKRLSFWEASGAVANHEFKEFDEDSLFINTVLDKLKLPNLSFYDPAARICDEEECRIMLDGIRMYSDPQHISLSGSFKLKDDILNAIKPAIEYPR